MSTSAQVHMAACELLTAGIHAVNLLSQGRSEPELNFTAGGQLAAFLSSSRSCNFLFGVLVHFSSLSNFLICSQTKNKSKKYMYCWTARTQWWFKGGTG